MHKQLTSIWWHDNRDEGNSADDEGEENLTDAHVKAMASSGANVTVTGSKQQTWLFAMLTSSIACC